MWVAWAYPAKPVHRFLLSVLDSAQLLPKRGPSRKGIRWEAFRALAHHPEGLAGGHHQPSALTSALCGWDWALAGVAGKKCDPPS